MWVAGSGLRIGHRPVSNGKRELFGVFHGTGNHGGHRRLPLVLDLRPIGRIGAHAEFSVYRRQARDPDHRGGRHLSRHGGKLPLGRP